MKNQFRSFKRTTDDELNTLWKDAIFVFDTNVLHSVYRYKESTCEDVLKLMEQLQKRVWIPYHVALEFHRNRLSVISSQHKKFDETRKAIKNTLDGLKKELASLQLDKRHSHIDPNPLIEGINKLILEYLDELNQQENQCIKVDSNDLLLSRIESIFDNRVGEKPINDDIRKIMDEGKERYKALIPPGYKDAIKEKDNDNKYTYNGVSYEKQFGDLIVWKQIIDHVNKKDIKNIIFVTDDNKEDWWEITQGKTTNFRTELIDEILATTNLQNFKAYSLASFLTASKQYLKNTVSQDTIEEIYLSYPDETCELIKNKKNGNIEDIPQDFINKLFIKNYNMHNVINDHSNQTENDQWFDAFNKVTNNDKVYEAYRNSKLKKSLQAQLNYLKNEIESTKSKIIQFENLNKDEREKVHVQDEYMKLVNIFIELSLQEEKLLDKINSLG